MDIYILHLFSVAGGSAQVSLEIARVLKQRGFKVIYVTNSSAAMKKVAELLGLPSEYDVIEINSFLERILGYTGRFIRYRRLLLLRKGLLKLSLIRESSNALVIDTDTNYPFGVDVSYIHYPLTMPTMHSNSLLYKLYNWLVKHEAEKMRSKPRLVLTNSSWTAKLLEETLGVSSEIVHPPVDVDYFLYDGREKENMIITISRLTPEKNLHLLPKIASKLSNYEWYLVGSTGVTGFELDVSRRVLRRIKREIEKLRVNNFHVITNIPRSELRELLLRARFYVHPFFPEHFGIAVAEATSAGCIPVVYRNGGAWTDIVSPISEKLGYNTLEEVPAIIRKLEEKKEELDELKMKAVKYSENFKAEVFREKLVNVLIKHGIIS